MGRPLLLFGLIWGSFLAVLPFAAFGDTSVLHISSHLIQLPLLAAATVLAWHCRRAAVGRARRALTWVLSVTVPVAFVSIAVELGIATAGSTSTPPTSGKKAPTSWSPASRSRR